MPLFVYFGEDDIVVAFVVAVRGRSPATVDIAAADDAGSLPVSSSFLIRDFKSSSSSQTVDGAAVEIVDSVVLRGMDLGRSTSSLPNTLRAVPGSALVLGLKYRCFRLSSWGCKEAAEE